MTIWQEHKISVLRDNNLLIIQLGDIELGDIICSNMSTSKVLFTYKFNSSRLLYRINNLIVSPNTLIPCIENVNVSNSVIYKKAKDINIQDSILLYNDSLEPVILKEYFIGKSIYVLTENGQITINNYSIPCYTNSFKQRFKMKPIRAIAKKSKLLANQKLYPLKSIF